MYIQHFSLLWYELRWYRMPVNNFVRIVADIAAAFN